ncbi:hypothetical protein ARTHRO9AX_150243 [Arthrobacter sp. 9AX]|nr:hypothetical protein ARTHRO9AX_150243 [Arthrobacter sp. 9AX]
MLQMPVKSPADATEGWQALTNVNGRRNFSGQFRVFVEKVPRKAGLRWAARSFTDIMSM